jgi:hypothetical protein
MMEATNSAEKSFLTRATRRHPPEDGILHSHGSEKLISYKVIHLETLHYVLKQTGFGDTHF